MVEFRKVADMSQIVGEGEHPDGVVQVTPNGISREFGPGINREWGNDGGVPYRLPKGWNAADKQGLWGDAEMEIDGKVIKGNPSNRTGE